MHNSDAEDEQENLRQLFIDAMIRQEQEQRESQFVEESPYLQIPIPILDPPPTDMTQEESTPEDRRVIIIDL